MSELPEGWETVCFGDVVQLSKQKYDPKKNDKDFPCIELEHIAQETGKIIGTVPVSTLESAKNKFQAGNVIFGKLRPYLRKFAIPEFNGVCSSEIWVFDTKKEIINPYLFQFIQTEKFITEANKSAGSKMPRADWSVVSELIFPLPPLPEQRKIAQILSTWDKAIATTEKRIANSKQQKKALMQQLLTGKKRLAGFSGDWEVVKLGDVGKILSGGTPSTSISEYWDGDIYWVTPTDITKLKERNIKCTTRKITKSGLRNSSAKLIPKNSLLVCTRATVGEMAINSSDMTTNQGFKNIIPNKNYDVCFIYYLLNENKSKLTSKASGSTFLELSKKDFESLSFEFPPLPEQQKIAQVLTTADKEISALETQLAHLQQEKKALMQQLLTGKRRVVVEES